MRILATIIIWAIIPNYGIDHRVDRPVEDDSPEILETMKRSFKDD